MVDIVEVVNARARAPVAPAGIIVPRASDAARPRSFAPTSWDASNARPRSTSRAVPSRASRGTPSIGRARGPCARAIARASRGAVRAMMHSSWTRARPSTTTPRRFCSTRFATRTRERRGTFEARSRRTCGRCGIGCGTRSTRPRRARRRDWDTRRTGASCFPRASRDSGAIERSSRARAVRRANG